MASKKIFIIEDDADIMYGLESQFSAANYELALSNGQEEMSELLDNLREFNPDCIILDLILPKLDGFEIVKLIKADSELGDKQIFIFTDLSDEDSRSRSLELGADYIFFKEEFDTFQFAEKVKRILANQEKIGSKLSENDEDDSGVVLD